MIKWLLTYLSWVAPQAWLGFIELDKAMVLVWLDWLVFCEYGFHARGQGWQLGGTTGGAVAAQAQEGLEELSHVEGQEWWR